MSTPSLTLSLGSHEFPLSATDLRIGRDPKNEVVLHDDSVSSFHAVFVLEQNSWLLKDLNATNGTSVNGRRIRETYVEAGDQIRFGDVEGVLSQEMSAGERACPSCKAPNKQNAKFCNACGFSLTAGKTVQSKHFHWMPRSQRGKSAVVAFLILTFFVYFHSPANMVAMLILGLGAMTVGRFIGCKIRGGSGEEEIPPPGSLWRRWPYRTALVCLLLSVGMKYGEVAITDSLLADYNGEIGLIEREVAELTSTGAAFARGLEAFVYAVNDDFTRGFELDRQANDQLSSYGAKYYRLTRVRHQKQQERENQVAGMIVGLVALLGTIGWSLPSFSKRST